MRYYFYLLWLGLLMICQIAIGGDLPPNVLCRPPLSILTDPGECSVEAYLLPPLILNGNSADFTIQNNAPNTFPQGTTTVTWQLMDMALNTYTCDQNVTVHDYEPPVLNCPNNLIVSTIEGECHILSSIIDNSANATDNCELWEIFHDAAAEIETGVNTVEWTAVDASGNVSTCEQTIRVRDNQFPEYLNCPSDILIELIENSCNPPVFWETPILTDNCGILIQNQSHTVGNVFELGETVVTYYAYDTNANYSECTFTISILDNTPPEFSFCPDDIQVETNNCQSAVSVNFLTPVVTDLCFFSYWVENDWQPGDLFPVGTTTVTLNTRDLANNLTTCAFDIVVQPKLEVLCSEVLEVSVAEGESTADIYWNLPQVATDCGNCSMDSLPDYEFLGHFAGHNYFRYTLPKVLWGFAEEFAEMQGGYLACINSEEENEFITSRMYPLTSAWIGLADWEEEGDFVWTNGEPLIYTNWVGDSIPILHENRDYVLLQNTGEWYPDYSYEKERFILEVPCWDYQNGQTSTEDAGQFLLGENIVNYSASDVCNNSCFCDMEILVTENTVDYCEISANPTVWIEDIIIANFSLNTGNNGGYGDYTEVEIIAAPSDCYFGLFPQGNDQLDPLYWRIWIDLNQDGDFYDANELIFEKTGIGAAQEFHELSNDIPTEATRMRVALSTNGLPAPCGNFHDGEVEDYMIKFVEPEGVIGEDDPCEEVEIVEFKAQTSELAVNLYWGVYEEMETAFYRVLKSSNGVDFSLLEEVASRNSTNANLYQLIDNQPVEGDNFYQIIGVSKDGCEEASEITGVHFAVDLTQFFLFPNPTNDAVFLNVEPFATASGQWKIVNELGQVLQSASFKNLQPEPLEINTKKLANGVYWLYFQAEGFRGQRRSFVVMN